MTERRSDTMMERRSERMRNFNAPDTDCKKAIYSSGLRTSKLSDSEFGVEGAGKARRSSTTDIDYTRNSEEGPSVDKTAFRRNGARFHSVSTSFGLTRYCAWVNPEANKESWQHREEVTSEHNLRHAAVQFALNDRREGDWMGTYEREIVGDALQKMLLFEQLKPTQLSECMRCMVEMEVAQGERVCTQGETNASDMFVVIAGSVDIWVKPHGEGEAKHVATVGPGGALGENALLHASTRTATVVSTAGWRFLGGGRAVRPAAQLSAVRHQIVRHRRGRALGGEAAMRGGGGAGGAQPRRGH